MSLHNLVLANALNDNKARSHRRDGAPPRSVSYVMPADYLKRLDAVVFRLGISRAALLATGLPEVLDLVEKASTPPTIPDIVKRKGDDVYNGGFPVKPELVGRCDAAARRCGCSRVTLNSWAMVQTIERAEKMLSAALAEKPKKK